MGVASVRRCVTGVARRFRSLARPPLTYPAVTHIALRVSPLRTAEAYYRDLFALTVAFREVQVTDGWRTLPDGATWDDAEAAGIALGLVLLHRDGFSLALEDADGTDGQGRLSHLGIQTSDDELTALRARVVALGHDLRHDRPDLLVFTDRYGVRWEMTTNAYDDPKRLTGGARSGRWLVLR